MSSTREEKTSFRVRWQGQLSAWCSPSLCCAAELLGGHHTVRAVTQTAVSDWCLSVLLMLLYLLAPTFAFNLVTTKLRCTLFLWGTVLHAIPKHLSAIALSVITVHVSSSQHACVCIPKSSIFAGTHVCFQFGYKKITVHVISLGHALARIPKLFVYHCSVCNHGACKFITACLCTHS